MGSMQCYRKMKRIGLFLGIEPNAGGLFQYVQSLLDALSTFPTDDYQIEVAYTSQTWKTVLDNYSFSVTRLKYGKLGLQLANVIMYLHIPGVIVRRFFSVCNPIAWQLNSLKCEAWIFPAHDAISYQLRLPVIGAVHDLMHRYERLWGPSIPGVAGGFRYYVREHRFSNLVNWAKGILVDSEVGRTHIVNSYGTDPAKIYSLPFIPPPYIHQSIENRIFDSKYNLPAKFFFYPSQFWPHKNHKTLISAAATIRPECPDIQLVFTGRKKHYYEQIRDYADSIDMLDRITFTGYVPDLDIPSFYLRARALVMPTFLGPTNIPPLEALACGCPVAVSGIYAMPEQLGDAALYFDPHSVNDMASKMKQLWLDDLSCQLLKERGYKKTASWNLNQFAARLKYILDRVLSGEG